MAVFMYDEYESGFFDCEEGFGDIGPLPWGLTMLLLIDSTSIFFWLCCIAYCEIVDLLKRQFVGSRKCLG